MALAACAALAATPAPTPTPTPTPEEAPYLRRYDVALVSFAEPRVVAAPDGAETRRNRAYLVRLFGAFPKRNGAALRLFIGERQIAPYEPFWGGVYFLVFSRQELRELAGGDIRYAYPDEAAPRLLAPRFQPRLSNLTHPWPFDRALARPGR